MTEAAVIVAAAIMIHGFMQALAKIEASRANERIHSQAVAFSRESEAAGRAERYGQSVRT